MSTNTPTVKNVSIANIPIGDRRAADPEKVEAVKDSIKPLPIKSCAKRQEVVKHPLWFRLVRVRGNVT